MDNSEAFHVSPVIGFQTWHLDSQQCSVGWLEKSKRIWKATQNVVEFFDRDTGQVWYYWEYKRSKSAVIFDVCECEDEQGKIYNLTVIHSGSNSVVCLLDFNRLIKIIELPAKITAMCNSSGAATLSAYSLLSAFHGVASFGCSGGLMFMVDLQMDINMNKCLDEKSCTPVSLREINPKDSPKVARKQLLKSGVHVYYSLNRHSTKRSGQFSYRSVDGTEFGNFSSSSVQVTAVAYLSQTNSQAVGYNFGCFQIFSLHNLSLVFSSTINQANPLAGVSHFALQEPENDPRKYLFLWVGHSAMDKHSPVYGSRMVMYQLAFEPRSGSQYGVLIGCASKLELPLSSHPYIPSKKLTGGSHLISCSTAPGLYSKDPASATAVDLTVMIFVWEAQSGDAGKVYHVGVFDLNRWYHAQMPRSIRWEKATTPKVCSFVTFHSLSAAIEEAQCPLIDAAVTRVSRFYSPPPMCEQHLWPSSISFDITCVYSTGLHNCQILGLEEAVLSRFVSLGSSSLDSPSEVYSQCVALNLLPQLTSDHHGDEQPVDVELQRRALLDLALERNFFSVLYSCAKSWTTGVLTTKGCTLSALLEWAWLKLMHLKQEKDELCQPLFDGTRIGDCLMQQLLQVHRSLTHLTHLFQVLLETSSTPMTEQGYTDLLTKCHGCAVHKNMLEVILWCIGNKVLPQVVDEGAHCLYYPLDKLKKLYTHLRLKKQPMESSYSLLVDILHDKLGCGEFMVDNGDDMFYPPVSMEQLINIYATQNTSLQHCIMMYYLTDLNTMADTVTFQLPSQLVASYAKEFSVPAQLASFAEGLWHLDHGSVEEAGRKLLCHVPTQPVDDVIFLLYPSIIRSFMDNDGAHQALKFASMFSARDPSSDSSQEKMLLHLDVLVAVGQLSDALSITRKSSDSEHDAELFNCFLDKCQQAKKLSLLVSQLLTAEEDAALCVYLEEHPSLCCLELLVMFHLQRSRYIDAIRTNAQLNERMRTLHNPQVWERSASRNAIVDGFARSLPACLRNLAFNQNIQPPPAPLPVPSHPQPLSTVVARESQAKVLSQAHYVSMVMQKVDETKQQEQQRHQPKIQLRKPATPLPATPLSTAQTDTLVSEPFVNSPIFSVQRSTVRVKPRPSIATPVSLLLTSTHKTPQQQQSSIVQYQDDDDVMMVDESAVTADVSTAPSIVSLMERVNSLKQLKLHECLRTPSMKRSPVINTSFKPPSSLRLPPQPILKSRTATPAVVPKTTAIASSVRKIRFAASMSPDSPSRSSDVVKSGSLLDSPVCISSGEDEDFYSPPAEINKEKAGNTPKPFGFDFTVDETDVVDLTAVDDASPSAVEATQSSPPVPSPHIRLMDFLSPMMTPKDIAGSLKQQHSLLSKSTDSLSPDQDNITSSVTEHISFTASTADCDGATGSVAEPDTTRQEDAGVVAQYEVTARSPMNYNETASIRQISPPQDPSELKRAALLPLDERLTTDPNTPPRSVNKSARVLIQKIDSPGSSMLKASIARGTVSVRKTKFRQSPSSPSLKVSATTTSLRSTSNLTQGYKFSPPVQVLSPEKPLNDSQTSAKGTSEQSPTMSFPFSPPLTRSQRRRTGSNLYRDTLTDDSTKVQLFSESVTEMSIDPVVADTTMATNTTVSAINDTTTNTTVTGKKDSSKKARTTISGSSSKSYSTRSRRASPRVGSNYDTVLLHPMPTPGSTPAKDQVVMRKTRQKSKAAHKPPLNLRRSSRLLDTDRKHK